MTKRYIDECIARGCGGLLRGVGDEVSDGEQYVCATCHRMHIAEVAEGAPVRWRIERKRAPRRA